MAAKTITTTELVRSIGDVLGRIRYRGETFIIEKNGTPVAKIVPIGRPRPAKSLRDFLSGWLDGPQDLELADLLERIDREDRSLETPWDTSSTRAR